MIVSHLTSPVVIRRGPRNDIEEDLFLYFTEERALLRTRHHKNDGGPSCFSQALSSAEILASGDSRPCSQSRTFRVERLLPIRAARLYRHYSLAPGPYLQEILRAESSEHVIKSCSSSALLQRKHYCSLCCHCQLSRTRTHVGSFEYALWVQILCQELDGEIQNQ